MTVVEKAAPGTVLIEEALDLGRVQLATLSVDVEQLKNEAHRNFDLVRDFTSHAVDHYYGKLGYDKTRAAELFSLVKRFLALAAAWSSQDCPGHLSLPERVDNDGWHGFLIQTRDYAAFAEQMGAFVHHATTDGGQGDAVTLTMALLEEVFGDINPVDWSDCPSCIIYGWCSSGTD